MTTINPLTRLDYPDPDIIRVGDTYYMVSTTMYFMPGCEILSSYDLVHWEHASYVYDTLDSTPAQRLESKENIYGQGMWAASLRYYDGFFYVCFVCNDTHRTYLYTSRDINGPWQKSYIDGFYHDNSILFDDDGRIYIVSGNRQLHLNELCVSYGENGHPTLAPKEDGLNRIILKDTEDAPLGYEGSHFYKLNGKYYLFVIGIPKDTGKRTESCFVADEPEGPYIGKKVMDDDRGYRRSGVAQGGIVDTPEGKWFSILFQDSGSVGRIPVLMPVEFKETAEYGLFPVFGDEGVIPAEFDTTSTKEGHTYIPLVQSDNFKDSTDGNAEHTNDSFGFKSCWQFNHEPDISLVKRNPEKGTVTITTGETVTNLVQARNTLTQRTMFPGCVGSVTLDGSNLKEGDYAGLSILLSSYGYIAMTKRNGDYYLVMSKREITTGGFWGERHDDEAPEEIESVKLDSPVVTLRCDICFDEKAKEKADTRKILIPLSDDTAVFSYSNGADFTQLGCQHKLQFKLDHFTGARFGLFMYSTKEAGGSATFSNFVYDTLD
ncbi:glycoside hydrolase 43 family protein [Butyrivibrio proteoclasticus]|uniref:glycoside hydrolase family 43 protein n=1 Tax=Butyrivibrio proteoclasticus TaxID=43305 RepID=UPI00047AA3FD|nr:glycoside hydrolase 43 family protein [Butyrivibrio proteoclasticus]